MNWIDFKYLVKYYGGLIFVAIFMVLFLWFVVELKDGVTLCWYSDTECLERIGYTGN